MPFVFNKLNYKLEQKEILEAEREAEKLKALGKQLQDNPKDVENLDRFINRYGWLPKDVIAGLGIASLTNPGLNLTDQEPFVRDLVNAWTKNNKENANRLTAALKGGLRAAFVGMDGAAERLIKRPIQAAGGVYVGENINPTVALFDIIPGLGFTLAKGFGMTNMKYSEFFAKREQKLNELGPTVAEESLRKLMKGEEVNLGSGFFGNSTLAEDTDVYKQISQQTQNPEILEEARSLIQKQLGDPITVNERKRVNSNSFKFDDGSIRPISPGLLLAHNVLTPEQKGYNMLSGLVDGIFTLGLDPANLVGGYMAKASRLKKSINPSVVKNRFITGRLARKMVNVPEGKAYLQTPAVREIAEIGAKSKNLTTQRSLVRDQIQDTTTLNKMVKAETPEEWIKAIEEYGIDNINRRFEKASKFHVDYKDGEKILRESPEHRKQRKVVQLIQEKYNKFDNSNPTGNFKDYSIRVQKNLFNSPLYRASKDLPQAVLNTLDLEETGMVLDDWLEFIGAPNGLRNAFSDEMVKIIKNYETRAQIAKDYQSGLLGEADIIALRNQFPNLSEVDLTRTPSIVKVRSAIQNLLTGDNKVYGLKYVSGVDDYGNPIIEKHTLFGWFDAENAANGLPPVAADLATKAVANINEGKRAYLTDNLGNPAITPINMTAQGTDAVFRGMQADTFKSLPTAAKLSEYLTYAIVMPDPREIARYVGNVRNSVAFLGQVFAKGPASADPKTTMDILKIATDRRGEALEKAAGGFIKSIAKNTRDAFKYRITDEGIEQATLLRVANKYMTKIWKPAALLRFAWTVRVVGEEQMRMWASDLDNVFTSPLSYFSYWFGSRSPMKTMAGNMANEVAYKSAMSKGHGGFIGVNNYGRNRYMTTVGKADKRYASYWWNNMALYHHDELGKDIFPVAADLLGKTLDVDDARLIIERSSKPLTKANMTEILGPDNTAVLQKNIIEFVKDLDDGIVVDSADFGTGTIIAKFLRRELGRATDQFRSARNQEIFNPSALIAKMIKMKANNPLFRIKMGAGKADIYVPKNQVLEELKRVLGDYQVKNAIRSEKLPVVKYGEELEFNLDKILKGETDILYGNGRVGDIVAIPGTDGKLSYFVVDRVDTIKRGKVNLDEEFALDINLAQDRLQSAGFSTSETNKILARLRQGEKKLTKGLRKEMQEDIDTALAVITRSNPISRIKRTKVDGKTTISVDEELLNSKDGIYEFKALGERFDLSSADKQAMKEIEHLSYRNAMYSLYDIVQKGFRRSLQTGKQISGKKSRFFTIRSQEVDGVVSDIIRPTRLGQKAIDIGLVDKADDLPFFAKNGSGQAIQAYKLMQTATQKFVDAGVKTRSVDDITEDLIDRMARGNKVLNQELDSLFRREQLLTLRPTHKASFNFAEDLVEHKVTTVISGGQTGADIAGIKAAQDMGIKTSGTIPRSYWTEDGRNFGLQDRYGLQPDRYPLDDVNLGSNKIIYGNPDNKFKFVPLKDDLGGWVQVRKDGQDIPENAQRFLDIKNPEDRGHIRRLEYRSRAIKNVDNAHVTILFVKPGLDSLGTKMTYNYATKRKWRKQDGHNFIFTGDDLDNTSKAKHKIFSNRVSNSRSDYSEYKDVVVINLDKFVADGNKIDNETLQKIDNILNYYDNPIVNIAGPKETAVTDIMSSKLKKETNKRQYQQDVLEQIPAKQTKIVKESKDKLKKIKAVFEIRSKEYKTLENGLHNALASMTKGTSKADFSRIRITIPPELKNLNEKQFKQAVADLKKTWFLRDRTGKKIRPLNKQEAFVAERELKKANAIYKQKMSAYDEIQRLEKRIGGEGVALPFDPNMRLSLEDSELYRPFEMLVRSAVTAVLDGKRKPMYSQSFEELVKKYQGESREYFYDLASDAFDNAQGIKSKVADSDVQIEAQVKSWLADLHLLAGGDYEVILRNTNDLNFKQVLGEDTIRIKNKKDPSLNIEVTDVTGYLDEPVTITVDGKKKSYRSVPKLLDENSDFYYDFAPQNVIPKNPTGTKAYNTLEEMYDDGYYFDYNITRTGDQEILRVMAGIDEFKVNTAGGVYKMKVGPNMTNAEQKAFIKWLETKKHLGPSRVKGAASIKQVGEESFAKAADTLIEEMFDLFMSGPTNMFSRSPAFMQFYMDKVRQLSRYADMKTKKRLVDTFEHAWGITSKEGVDVGLVRKIFAVDKDAWFDKNFRQEFLEEMAIPSVNDAFDISDVKPQNRMRMDFDMAPSDNIYGKKTTTMDLVLQGKRTSTTRQFKEGPPEVGDILQFKDRNNNQVLVKVTEVNDWKSIAKDANKLTEWSKAEGWTVKYALEKAFFRDKDDVFQVKYSLYTDKVYTDFEQIDTIAKAYALEETKRLLYDLDKRGQVTDALRLVFPFGEAYKEILSTQFRLLKNNPQKLRKAQIAIEGARTDSIFGSDPNHNEGFFSKDPMTGEEVYNFADPGGLLSGLVVGDSVDNTGVRLNMKGYTRNLNMMTTTILPGVGPLVQVPASAFASATEFTKLSDFLFPYGRPEVRSGVAGVLDIPKAFAQASIPSYMRKVLAAISPNPSGRADLEGFDPGSDPAGALASTTKDILKVRAYAGTADFSSVESQNAEIKSAVRAARGLTAIRAAVQFIWFTGAEPRYEQSISPKGTATIGGEKVSVSDIMFLDPSKTKDIDPEGTLVGFNQLVQSYYRLYELAHEAIRNNAELADQDPQFIATQAYMTLFGANPVPLLIRKTREITPYPLGESGLQWARENKEVFSKYPNTATFAKPYEPFDEFDIRAWRESISTGARVGLTPEQWIHLNNQANGRIAITHIQDTVNNDPTFTYWTPMQKQTYIASMKSLLYDLYPGFGSELTAAGPTDLNTKLRELRDWDKDTYLKNTETGKALEAYFKHRDELMAFYKLKTGNPLSNIEGGQAINIRNALRLYANQLIIQYPEFRFVYNSILSRELEEDERSVPDGFRILGM